MPSERLKMEYVMTLSIDRTITVDTDAEHATLKAVLPTLFDPQSPYRTKAGIVAGKAFLATLREDLQKICPSLHMEVE